MQPLRRRTASLLSVICLAAFATRSLAADASASPTIADCSIGFSGTFKVGHWTPVEVVVEGDPAATKSTIEAIALDSDGVEVTTSTAAVSGKNVLYTRVGRFGSSVRVRLLVGGGRVLDRAELATAGPFAPLPATGELLVQIGPGDLDIEKLIDRRDVGDGRAASAAVQIVDVESLPIDWFGYEAVDVLVLSTGDSAFCERLVADERRFAALREWLELGGRLVVCAGHNAPALLGPGMPLADFAPGQITELVRLPQAQALESFAGSGDAIRQSGPQQNIPLPRLVDVEGVVELHGRANELPIVVRAARGLGELEYVGIDLTESPFADWNGRTAFLKRVLRPYLSTDNTIHSRQKIVSLGYDDLAGALRQLLGRSFNGVAAIGFPWVAALVIGYLLVLGPLDYWFVDRLTQRPWVAWLTLPVIVLGTCVVAAMLAGASRRTDSPQLNHAELVDFDLTTGRTRGSCWATLFSPQARQFDVKLEPHNAAGAAAAGARPLVTWWGLPGTGLGGMHAAGEPLDVTGVGYRAADNLRELRGVPVLTAATKSFTAQWTASHEAAAPPIAFDLSVDDQGLLVGSVTNNTGARLANAYLLHGTWGYYLGDLEPGKPFEIGSGRRANRVKSILSRRALAGAASDQETFFADRANAAELLTVMMFYEAVGGDAFVGLPNEYQSRLDLSHLLAFDRAILVASAKSTGSEWQQAADGEPLATSDDSSTVLYRFILPLKARPSTLNTQP